MNLEPLPPIPVTIITGFLGAGKTTLINRLLAQAPQTRFAVVENEIGAIPIDAQLVLSATDSLYPLASGCLCCDLSSEFVGLLLRLQREAATAFDHLLIETTGMADPAGVALPLLTHPALQAAYRLQGIVTVVDLPHLKANLHDQPEAYQQIAQADLLVLSKLDALEPSLLTEHLNRLQTINPLAQLHRDPATAPAAVLHLSPPNPELLARQLSQTAPATPHPGEPVRAHTFSFQQPFDYLKFLHWTRVLLLVQGANVYRIKGIFDFKGHEQKMAFQAVRREGVFQALGPWPAGETRQSQVVVIGKGLQKEPFQRALSTCLAK